MRAQHGTAGQSRALTLVDTGSIVDDSDVVAGWEALAVERVVHGGLGAGGAQEGTRQQGDILNELHLPG